LKKLSIAVIVVAAAAIAGVLVLLARQPQRTTPVERPPTRAAVDGGDGASATTDGITPTREPPTDAPDIDLTDVDTEVVGGPRILVALLKEIEAQRTVLKKTSPAMCVNRR
jgi:hypothetical protein